MSDWQPIETAPKDGTPVLVWEYYTGISVADWGETSVYSDRKRGKGMDWCVGQCCDENDRNIRHTVEPTHWMPLPEAPKERP